MWPYFPWDAGAVVKLVYILVLVVAWADRTALFANDIQHPNSIKSIFVGGVGISPGHRQKCYEKTHKSWLLLSLCRNERLPTCAKLRKRIPGQKIAITSVYLSPIIYFSHGFNSTSSTNPENMRKFESQRVSYDVSGEPLSGITRGYLPCIRRSKPPTLW